MVGITVRAGVFAVALFVFAGADRAFANTIIDLTAANAPGSTQTAAIGGSFTVQQTSTQPTGTGFIDSFLRIQQSPSERGYNTNNGTPLDDKGGNFTHALLLSDLGVTNIGGVDYYHFVLDINENHDNLISLNQIQIFRAAADPATFTLTEASAGSSSQISFGGASEVFRMNNTGNLSAYEIQLNYSLNSGSGSGDMDLFVRKSSIDAGSGNYVVLYSQFGNPSGAYASDAGFEEWWSVRTAPCTSPTCSPHVGAPEPSSVLLLGTGLVALALIARQRSGQK